MEIRGDGSFEVPLEFAIRDRRSLDPDFVADNADAADLSDLVFSVLACGIESDAAGEDDLISESADLHVFVLGRAQGPGGRRGDEIRVLGEANG